MNIKVNCMACLSMHTRSDAMVSNGDRVIHASRCDHPGCKADHPMCGPKNTYPAPKMDRTR